jgi:hypothetical protein
MDGSLKEAALSTVWPYHATLQRAIAHTTTPQRCKSIWHAGSKQADGHRSAAGKDSNVEDEHPTITSLEASWRTLRRQMPDIHQDSYTVEGLSHLLGIPREVITHEIISGQLKAVRGSRRILCIERGEVLAWLRRRGPGV